MRLIRIEPFALTGRISFFEPIGDEVVPYAILSHTWGDDEVTYHDVKDPAEAYQSKSGYTKLSDFLSMSRKLGFSHAWVDACCIEKSSSAELSEAINSMYNWYRSSSMCLVYLADVHVLVENRDKELYDKHERRDAEVPVRFQIGNGCVELKDSRWFTRGWTLQELVAPSETVFFDRFWYRFSLTRHQLFEVTSIPTTALEGNLDDFCVAEKMHWASKRHTTRGEDTAYCLMGLFDVNMPLLYGEGSTKAFLRLQEEILRRSDDETIFLWRDQEAQDGAYRGVFARHPAEFNISTIDQDINHSSRSPQVQPFSITNSGLQMFLALFSLSTAPFAEIDRTVVALKSSIEADDLDHLYIPVLHCLRSSPPRYYYSASIILKRARKNSPHFVRIRPDLVVQLDRDETLERMTAIESQPTQPTNTFSTDSALKAVDAANHLPRIAQIFIHQYVKLRHTNAAQPVSGFALHNKSRHGIRMGEVLRRYYFLDWSGL